MCARIKTSEIVVCAAITLLWGTLAAGQGGGMAGGMGGGMGGGTTTPPKVDYSDNFAALWDRVDLSVSLCNTQEDRPDAGAPMTRSLSITGVVDVLDSENVMGISTDNMKVVYILNETESAFQCLSPYSVQNIPTYRGIETPVPFTIQLSLGDNEAWPLALSSVECQVAALYTEGYEVFDIPFAPTDQWIALKPGIHVQVEQALCDGLGFGYVLRIRYEGKDPTLFQMSRYTNHLPDDLVMQIELLDAAGISVPEASTGSFRIDNTNIRTGKGAAPEIQTIQFRLATKPRSETITLRMTDLPVPAFPEMRP